MERAARRALLSSGLQAAANLATIIAACLLSTVLVRTYFVPSPLARRAAVSPASRAFVGSSFKSRLPDINWNANGQTVLLVLSTHCHFCSESIPFFRQLGEESGKALKIVAALPEPISEAKDYLNRSGVRVDQLRQVALEKLGVAGTPTMLLVNGNGVVTRSWVGELSPEEQDRAFKAIVHAKG